MKPLIKKEDKSPNKRQAESTLVYILYSKSPLNEDNLSTKDKTACPKSVLIKRFHCKAPWVLQALETLIQLHPSSSGLKKPGTKIGVILRAYSLVKSFEP